MEPIGAELPPRTVDDIVAEVQFMFDNSAEADDDDSTPATSDTNDVQLLEPPKPTLKEANGHLNNLLRYPNLTSTQRKQLLEIKRAFMKEDAAKQKQSQLSQFFNQQAQDESESTPP